MRRREFIAALGGAAAWPLVARAQKALPVIGVLLPTLLETSAERLRGFRQGLTGSGFIEGENVTVIYRWAENEMDRMPGLAAELVRRQVTVLVTGGLPAAIAAKAATTAIPSVFVIADDPVKLDLVTSVSRPDGNMTGINVLNSELAAKRLELLHSLSPKITRIAALSNPAEGAQNERQIRELELAGRAMGLQIHVLPVNTSDEIDSVFATFNREPADALFVPNSPFLNGRRVQLVQLAAYHRLPAAYGGREYAEIGGLMSYGSNIVDAFRQAGVYAGRMLKGAKAADLPVIQATKIELIINHQTARMLGITVPHALLTSADEVIE